MAVTIFLLLAGGIFAAVSTASRTAADLTLSRLQSERLDALHRFLSHLWANLPTTATLELRIDSKRLKAGSAELLISPAPSFADFASATRSGGLALGLSADSGSPTFSAANFDAALSGSSRDEDLLHSPWIPLLPEVTAIRWRFQPEGQAGWQEVWRPENGRPVLADLEIGLSDGSSEQWLFVIPRLQKISQASGEGSSQ